MSITREYSEMWINIGAICTNVTDETKIRISCCRDLRSIGLSNLLGLDDQIGVLFLVAVAEYQCSMTTQDHMAENTE